MILSTHCPGFAIPLRAVQRPVQPAEATVTHTAPTDRASTCEAAWPSVLQPWVHALKTKTAWSGPRLHMVLPLCFCLNYTRYNNANYTIQQCKSLHRCAAKRCMHSRQPTKCFGEGKHAVAPAAVVCSGMYSWAGVMRQHMLLIPQHSEHASRAQSPFDAHAIP
jgi:hypothetical protein